MRLDKLGRIWAECFWLWCEGLGPRVSLDVGQEWAGEFRKGNKTERCWYGVPILSFSTLR